MMIQEWVYLGLAVYGFISLIFTLAYVSLWIDNKRLQSKSNKKISNELDLLYLELQKGKEINVADFIKEKI
ncbi:hypothetical protein [uncultured Mediterranean phage uvMED]|jgi:hypothetical protein|nr:hypothetical protein [uncultured Mediterranean phage uvMED]